MDQRILAPDRVAPARDGMGAARAIVVAAVTFGVVLIGGAIALWAHYGTTVFFEMIKSGIAACM